jgi:mitochondrial translocator assembly and maintenance protein 41
MTSHFLLQVLRSHLNESPFLAAFAYGSGVFKQAGGGGGESVNKMIDYLVIIDDTSTSDDTGASNDTSKSNALSQWHLKNSLSNPTDYSLLAKFMTIRTKAFTNRSVYYVPDVLVSTGANARRIKYGVLGWSQLIGDLYTWESLFLAGRLHKPTIRFDCTNSEFAKRSLSQAMDFNLNAAIHAALLLTPPQSQPINFPTLLETIVRISYLGDPRLVLAENPHKIQNILSGQFDQLAAMFHDKFVTFMHESNNARLLADPLYKAKMICNLPIGLRKQLASFISPWSLALCKDSHLYMAKAIAAIVRRSSWRQMILGAICTPPSVSISYSLSKIKKRFI